MYAIRSARLGQPASTHASAQTRSLRVSQTLLAMRMGLMRRWPSQPEPPHGHESSRLWAVPLVAGLRSGSSVGRELRLEEEVAVMAVLSAVTELQADDDESRCELSVHAI